MPPHPVHHHGQKAWVHDEGHRAGLFHTYDHLSIGGPPRKVHVFLPREATSPGRRFPVALFLDGHTAFWPGGEAHDTWDVAGVLSRRSPGAPPIIAVAVHPLDRNEEHTHADWCHGERSFGGLATHASWLADRLKPWIDAAYPTLPAAHTSLIIGSSHGGLAVFWTATRHPEVFGAAGCLSPSFFTGLDSLRHGPSTRSLREAPLYRDVEALLCEPTRRPRLWIDWGGRRDGGEHNAVVEHLAALRGEEMIGLLRACGYRFADLPPGAAPSAGAELYRCFDPAAGHEERAWRGRLGAVLQALLPQ